MAISRNEKRAFLEITRDILEVARQGARRTHIMYRANLSYELLEKYLDRLIGSGLLWVDGSKRIYKVTEKGTRFIEDYEELKRAEEFSAAKRFFLDKILGR